jgi:hypothetical protein
VPHKECSNPAPSYNWTDIWCWQIVSLAFLVFTGAVLGFVFDFAISWIHFPAALLLIVLAGLWLFRQNRAGLNAKWYAVASQLVFLAFLWTCMAAIVLTIFRSILRMRTGLTGQASIFRKGMKPLVGTPFRF